MARKTTTKPAAKKVVKKSTKKLTPPPKKVEPKQEKTASVYLFWVEHTVNGGRVVTRLEGKFTEGVDITSAAHVNVMEKSFGEQRNLDHPFIRNYKFLRKEKV